MINRSEGIQFDSHISHEKIRVKNDEDILKNILNDFFFRYIYYSLRENRGGRRVIMPPTY